MQINVLIYTVQMVMQELKGLIMLQKRLVAEYHLIEPTGNASAVFVDSLALHWYNKGSTSPELPMALADRRQY